MKTLLQINPCLWSTDLSTEPVECTSKIKVSALSKYWCICSTLNTHAQQIYTEWNLFIVILHMINGYEILWRCRMFVMLVGWSLNTSLVPKQMFSSTANKKPINSNTFSHIVCYPNKVNWPKLWSIRVQRNKIDKMKLCAHEFSHSIRNHVNMRFRNINQAIDFKLQDRT